MRWGSFCSGLAYKIILYFLDKLAATTTGENPTALRFRSVASGPAPPVVINARTNVGFLRIPPHLKPLVQGNSTSFRYGSTPVVQTVVAGQECHPHSLFS